MTPRQKFFALAAEHGVEVNYTPGNFGPYQMELVAPEGKMFSTSESIFDCSLMGWDDDPRSAPWQKLLPELRQIIAAGFLIAEPDIDNI